MVFSSRQFWGWLAVFSSAFCFYLATTIIRWSETYTDIAPAAFVFCRFLLGFLVVVFFMLLRGQRPRPQNYHLLLGRTFANAVAVFCFYKAVAVGSVAGANILNMTYPLFVALISWFVLRQQRDRVSVAAIFVAFIGIWLVVSPGRFALEELNLWGLASGITSAVAIVYLNLCRRYNDSQTILLFLFGLGAVVIYLGFSDAIFWPERTDFLFLFACSIAGVMGQYLLTYGFLFVSAVEGSIISSSRILFAALLGPLMTGEPPLQLLGWTGALLIFSANAILAIRKSRVS